MAKTLLVFLYTDTRYAGSNAQSNAAKVTLDVASSHPSELIKAARLALQLVFNQGTGYKKAGVIVSDITGVARLLYLMWSIGSDKTDYLRLLSKLKIRMVKICLRLPLKVLLNWEITWIENLFLSIIPPTLVI